MAKKILVVDDSPTILEMMQATLEDAGYEVIIAADGQDALDRAKKEKPDLIILDLMLPKIDGYKVCAMLKFDQTYKNIPVIILTARAGDEDKQIGKDVHADAYLTKPFEPQVLLDKIKEIIK